MRPQEKRPRALAGAGAAGSLKARQSYPTYADFQSPGEQLAVHWNNAATRFLSAYFRALTDAPIPAIARIIEAVRSEKATLSPMQFPTPAHWNLTAILCAFSEKRITPTCAIVLAVAEQGGFELPIGGGDSLAELRAVLTCESSAAGISSWIRELGECSRKHHRVKRLWGALRDYLSTDATGAAPKASPIIITRARRRFA